MALFERKRFVWYEPWFFQQRIRTAKSWLLFSLLLLAVACAAGAAIFFSAPPGNPVSLLQCAGLSLGLAAAVWWVLDGTQTRRQAVLFQDSIVVGGDMGKYSVPTTYKLSAIRVAAIVLPEESKWPAPALFFHYEGQEQAIGIELQAGLKRLAQAIHDCGVPVLLDGWQPSQENEFQRASSWRADPEQVVERATLATLPAGAASLMTPGGILLAIVQQSWAIVLWLLLTCGAIYYGYQNWGDLGLFHVVLLIGIPIAAMRIAGEYTDRIATATTSHTLSRMATNQIRKRSGLEIDLDAELIPVEILARDQFANTVRKIHELGYLQADPSAGRMLFEGKKQRWCIPARSIQSLVIEEVQTGTPGQSALGSLNYYVVVRFRGASPAAAPGNPMSFSLAAPAVPLAAHGEELEFGFRNSDRDYGEQNDIKRAAGAIRVYEAFESILPRG